MSTSIKKRTLILSIAQYVAIPTLDADVEYNVTDMPTNSISSSLMTTVINNDYSRLFKDEMTFICEDTGGSYVQGHTYKLSIVGGVKSWVDITVDTTYTAGAGIGITGSEISNIGVTSVNGNTGAVTNITPIPTTDVGILTDVSGQTYKACEDVYYTLDTTNNTASVTDTANTSIATATIYSYLKNTDGKIYKVTSIDSSAFYNCSALENITIPSSVTSIGDLAFSGCSGLTGVTIPGSVTSIDGSAFYNCSGLTSITIPSSVTSIGDMAFWGCSTMLTLKIENSLTVIPYTISMLSNCSALTKIIVPKNLLSDYKQATGWSTFASIICSEVTDLDYATTTAAGVMSSTDKIKLDSIEAGAEVNVQSDWSATDGDALILNKPSINNGTLEIQKNGTQIAVFTANQSGNVTANLPIPVVASDVHALPDTTKYGKTIDLNYTANTGVLDLTLKDQDGTTLSTDSVDLPLELLIESGSVKTCETANVPVQGYVVGDKYIDLVLANLTHIYILVSDLVDQVTITEIGSGNAVTDISVSGNVITETKGKTFVETVGGKIGSTVATFSDVPGTAENIVTGESAATIFGKIKNWFSRLGTLAFKSKTAVGDYTAGSIVNADISTSASIAISKLDLTTIRNLLYPIGSIKMTTVNTNPSTYLGGTWVAWGAGRVPVGVNTGNTLFDSVEEEGGSADAIVVSHTHTATQGSHTHTATQGSHTHTVSSVAAGSHTHSGTTASGGTHNHQAMNKIQRDLAPDSSGEYTANTEGSSNYTSNAGSHTHTFTTGGAGSHNHTINIGSATPTIEVTSTTPAIEVTNTGADGTNANYQPYITCYMWKRTA